MAISAISKDMLKNRIASRNFYASSENAEPATKTYQEEIRREAVKRLQPKRKHCSRKNVFQHVQKDSLEIKDLHAKIDGKKILNGVTVTIKSGEIHAIMGPNGSGKSTLCHVIMGHPRYEVEKGSIKFNGKAILRLEPDQRANLGLFLGFQAPLEIPGVTLGNFLRQAKNSLAKARDKNTTPMSPMSFIKIMKEHLEELKMEPSFAGRSINEGFSGGEKKRAEIVQMSVLKPRIALLDEIDSGLDIDALKIVSEGINKYFAKSHAGILLITHYQRLLNYITPHYVHVMSKGKIVQSGGKELAEKLEKEGYQKYIS